jgi:hypothetical protein
MITREMLKAARWNSTFLDGAGFWSQTHRCVDYPRLVCVAEGPRGRSKRPASRTFLVDRRPFGTLDAAIDALNQPPPEGT